MNPGRIPWDTNPHFKLGMTPWNKGLTKETSPSIAAQAKKSSKRQKGHPGHKHSPETKLLLSQKAIERGLGSKTNKPGWGKKGWYEDIWCDSSWELAFVLYCKHNNIPIGRSNVKLTYIINGVVKSYYPDFLVNGVLTEIKGRPDDRWKAKKLYNPHIDVYDGERMKPILSWAKLTYGKDFIYLYTGSKKEEIKPPTKVGGSNALTSEEINKRLKLIEGVDLTKFGWLKKVSDLLCLSHTQVRRFMDLHYPGVTYNRK
jgi:hypothetical protein